MEVSGTPRRFNVNNISWELKSHLFWQDSNKKAKLQGISYEIRLL